MAMRFLRGAVNRIRSPSPERRTAPSQLVAQENAQRDDSNSLTSTDDDDEGSFGSSFSKVELLSDGEHKEDHSSGNESSSNWSESDSSSSSSGSSRTSNSTDSSRSRRKIHKHHTTLRHKVELEDDASMMSSSSSDSECSRSCESYDSNDEDDDETTTSSIVSDRLAAHKKLTQLAATAWLSSGGDDSSDDSEFEKETRPRRMSRSQFQHNMSNFISQADQSLKEQQRLANKLKELNVSEQYFPPAPAQFLNQSGDAEYRVGPGCGTVFGTICSVHGVSANKLLVKVTYMDAQSDGKLDVTFGLKTHVYSTATVEANGAYNVDIDETFSLNVDAPLRYRDSYDEDIVQVPDWNAVTGCLLLSCFDTVKHSKHFIGQLLVPVRRLVDGTNLSEVHGADQATHDIIGTLTQRDGVTLAAGELRVQLHLRLPAPEPITPRECAVNKGRSERSLNKGGKLKSKSNTHDRGGVHSKDQRERDRRRKQRVKELKVQAALRKRKEIERNRRRTLLEQQRNQENRKLQLRIERSKNQTARAIRHEQRRMQDLEVRQQHQRKKRSSSNKTLAKDSPNPSDLAIEVSKARENVALLDEQLSDLRRQVVKEKLERKQAEKLKKDLKEALTMNHENIEFTNQANNVTGTTTTRKSSQIIARLKSQVIQLATEFEQHRQRAQEAQKQQIQLRDTILLQEEQLKQVDAELELAYFRSRNRENVTATADKDTVDDSMVEHHQQIETLLQEERRAKLELVLTQEKLQRMEKDHPRNIRKLKHEVIHYTEKLERKEKKCNEYQKKVDELKLRLLNSSSSTEDISVVSGSNVVVPDSLDQDPEISQLKAHISSLCAAISTARQQQRRRGSLVC